nr:hypothetical protein [Tanacetum cinerariifolium]
MLGNVRSSATSVERLGTKQGHTKNPCPKKVKQEEVSEVRGRAYAIRYVEPQGPNVVTGTFLLNIRYAFVLFDSGSNRSFIDTRFSSMLDINPIKIATSNEVELADERIVSTNTVLKGFTLNLVNHFFEIDLMPIELGTFDLIIGMDCLVKHDDVIIFAHVTKKKPKENRLEDVPVIRDFPEVFPDDLPELPTPRQVEFELINVRSRKAIRSEMTIRSEKTIESEKNGLEVRRPFGVREDVLQDGGSCSDRLEDLPKPKMNLGQRIHRSMECKSSAGATQQLQQEVFFTSSGKILWHDGNDKVIMWYQEPKFGLELCLVDSRMIPELGDANREVNVTETFHLQTDDELFDKELKQIEADNQAIQTILLGLLEDIYAAVDIPHQDQSSLNHNYLQQPMPNPKDIADPTTAINMALALMAKAFKLNYSTLTNNNQRISSNPRNKQIAQPGMNMGQDRQIQMVGGNGGNQFRQYAGKNNPRVQNVGNQNGLIGVQDGSAEVHENYDNNEIFIMFTQEEQYTELLEPIPESPQVPQNDNDVIFEDTSMEQDDELSDKELKQIEADYQAIQTILLGLLEDIYAATKDLHTADYTQLYDFLKYNQKEVDELKADRLAKTQDPLALMANSNNPYVSHNCNEYGTPINGQSIQAKLLNTNQQQSKNLSNPWNRQIAQPGMNMGQDRQIQMVGGNGGNQFRQYAGNPAGYNDVIGNQLRYMKICDDNEIFNMFTQEEQYTKLLKPIPESHQVPHNDNDVISVNTSVEQGGETVEQHPANFEETRALYESLCM